MQDKHLILIISAISTCDKPLAYTPTRSAFTHQQRFEQSLRTIENIKLNIPNAYIVFVEGTCISTEMIDLIKERVDFFYPAYEDSIVYEHVNGEHKGMGEASSILSYLKSSHFNTINEDCLSITKISGRYYPCQGFTWEYLQDGLLCHIKFDNPHHSTRIWMSTMFYTVGYKSIPLYIKSLEECINNQELQNGIAFEHVLPNCFKNNNIKIIQKIPFHVGGEYGPWGGYVEH